MAPISGIREMNCMNAAIPTFLYFWDANEPDKLAKAQQLLADLARTPTETFLLWQVAGELLNWLRKWERAGRVSSVDVEAHFRNFLAMFPLAVPGANLFQKYFYSYSRFSLSHWDAMLLAACKQNGVTTLYSEDMDTGTNYDGVIVVNPFA